MLQEEHKLLRGGRGREGQLQELERNDEREVGEREGGREHDVWVGVDDLQLKISSVQEVVWLGFETTYVGVEVDVAGDEAGVREDADDERDPEPTPAKHYSAGLLDSVPFVHGQLVLCNTFS